MREERRGESDRSKEILFKRRHTATPLRLTPPFSLRDLRLPRILRDGLIRSMRLMLPGKPLRQ